MPIKILSDLVDVVSEHISNPGTSGFEIFVGLEHYDSGDPVITRYGSTNNLASSVKHFVSGDILVARRNVYLRRAGVVRFEGVTSGDSIVLRVKDKEYSDILPFILNTDDFWDYAEQNSDGTMSKRLAPDVLLEYECNIPDNHYQIANKLWAAYHLKESYKRLLTATDEMVKSQFIEMFGDVEKKPFVDVCISKGEYGSNSPADDYDGNIRYVRITDITEEGNLNGVVVSPRKVEEKYMLLQDDLLFARTGNTVGKTYLHKNGKMIFAGYLIRYRLNKKLMLPQFAFAYTHTNQYYDWVEKIKKVGAQPNISAAQYDSMPIPVPSMAKQIEFVAIAKQADKSKFVGFKSQFIEMYRRAHKEMTLESVCTIMGKGITPKYVDSSSVVVINQACVHWDGQHLENVKYHNKNVPVKKRTLETGDVLLNATGNGTLGRCCVFSCPSDENQYVNDGHVIAISTDRSVILPEVLNSYLSLSDTQAEIYRQYVTGSTNQIDIVFTDIKKMTVPVPNMREQLQFVSTLQQADKSKYYN